MTRKGRAGNGIGDLAGDGKREEINANCGNGESARARPIPPLRSCSRGSKLSASESPSNVISKS